MHKETKEVISGTGIASETPGRNSHEPYAEADQDSTENRAFRVSETEAETGRASTKSPTMSVSDETKGQRVLTRKQVVERVLLIGLLLQLILYTISFSRLVALTASNPWETVQGPELTVGAIDFTGLLFWCYGLFLLDLPWPRWLKRIGSLASLYVVLWTVYANLHAWGM